MSYGDWFVVTFTFLQLCAAGFYLFQGEYPQAVLWSGIVVANLGILWSTH